MEVSLKLALEPVSEAEPIEARCVEPATSLADVLGGLDAQSGGILVCHEGMLVGIFT